VPVVDGNVLCRLQSRPLFHCPLLDHSLMAFDIKSIIDYTYTHIHTENRRPRPLYQSRPLFATVLEAAYDVIQLWLT